MPIPSDERKNVAKRNAQRHFTATEQRDELVREEQEKQRAKTTAKIAKLRDLRLAKERADEQTSGSGTMATTRAKSATTKRRKD
jgi:hypothetical protein